MLGIVSTVAFYGGQQHPVERKQYHQRPNGQKGIDHAVFHLAAGLGRPLQLFIIDLILHTGQREGQVVDLDLKGAIFAAALLTGLGLFDNIAKHAGAGTLIPITGFANAVVSPAIDSKSEGFVLGVGAKIFTVCGPVILYGTLAGAIYGVIYYISLFF